MLHVLSANTLETDIWHFLDNIHCNKKRLYCLFGGIGKVWYSLAASKEPNH